MATDRELGLTKWARALCCLSHGAAGEVALERVSGSHAHLTGCSFVHCFFTAGARGDGPWIVRNAREIYVLDPDGAWHEVATPAPHAQGQRAGHGEMASMTDMKENMPVEQNMGNAHDAKQH